MKIELTLLFAAPILFLAIPSFAQDGTKLIGYDAKTIGRGGTVTGFFDNTTLLQTNPAGISFLTSSELDFGAGILAPQLHFKNSINDANGKSNKYPLVTISYVHKPSNKFTYGFGVFTEGGLGADFSLNDELYKDQSGQYVKQPYHSKFDVLEGGGSLAYKITDKFSVGGTAQLVYSQLQFGAPLSLSPSLLKGVINPQTGYTFGNLFSGAPSSGGLGYSELTGTANISGLTAWGFSGKIGFAYKPTDRLSFGLNYTLPTSLSFKGGTSNLDLTYQFNDAFGRVVAGIIQQNPGTTQAQAQQQATQQFTQLGIDLTKGVKDTYAADAGLKLPQSISGGFSYAASKKIRFGADVEWINWANAFSNLNINLTQGTNPNINRLLGTNGTIAIPFPLQWKNTIEIRTGGEVDVTQGITLRAGYIYGGNPVPANTVFPIFPAIVKHHLTLGGSVKLSSVVALNLAYEHAFNNDETASSASLIGSQYNNSTSSLATNVYHVSISWLLR
ncbi:long-subunit fatty acid transport protein [Mucilaginibacter frigoritolerans]|uniref:Long-subunit fatty acid transport protein n=1 Tax=Mucilaginibacter frigoritolerans TaxID=652788 RepID=A0A562TQC7_9SPHI|nr:outer membrane protein transport protein [Mucilaginibacter frigoritolerans]TWI95296.1 long-subunit fatty acid transport protein [Mucilaginibacter frigoritolerans]